MTVLLTKGTFKTTNSIDAGPSTGVVLQGCGRQRTIINNTSTNPALKTTGSIRSLTIEHLQVQSAGSCIVFGNDIGGIDLRNLWLVPGGGYIGVEEPGIDGIDIRMYQVRVQPGGSAPSYGFYIHPSGIINAVTMQNCYANACTNGYAFLNVSNGILLNCYADGTYNAFDMAGDITLIGCTAENASNRSFIFQSSTGIIICMNCRTTGSISYPTSVPFSILAAAQVFLIQPITLSTQPSNSLELNASATGNNVLLWPVFDKAIFIGAGAVLHQNELQGNWTPSFTNLTVVNGTGGATYSGRWVKNGRLVYVSWKILVTGTCTTASTANSTVITNLPFNVKQQAGMPVSDGNIANIGVGSLYNALNAWCPTWSARNTAVYGSGVYETDDM